jgi:DNA-binding response OmpR family regulator
MIRSNADPEVAVTRCLLVAQGTSNQMFSWQAGIDAFLVRPFHAEELLAAVAEVIERPEAERPRHRRQQADEASASGRHAT